MDYTGEAAAPTGLLLSNADLLTDRLGDATRSRIRIVRKVSNRTL